MKVTIYGVGYVGLVQGAVLAEVGHDVLCVDIDESKVSDLKEGHIPIYEPGLECLVKNNFQKGNLKFTANQQEGVDHGGIQFIAVGTPPDEDGSADLKYVLAVAKSIASHMSTSKIIVNKSTVPVGTADKVRQVVQAELNRREKHNLDFDVISNPEFLKEGSAVTDCMRPDRIVIGTSCSASESIMRELYAPFNRNHEKIVAMDVRSAELTKYAANCLLATKISFMNEIAGLSELLGADIEMVRHGIGSDPRIGYQFIYPGAGYGGSCFPKDVQALIRTAESLDFDAGILKSVEKRNKEQKKVVFRKIHEFFNGQISGRTFALWGLSFKPNTDDMREAPSRILIEALWAAGASVRAYDPEAMNEARRIYRDDKNLVLCEDKYATLKGADALIVITEWPEFKAPDFEKITSKLSTPAIFDGRNIYCKTELEKLGISYVSIGRK
ncbi:UDP-glucose dehydrogenase family protein [Pseudomonas sp. BGr12]|uniref:UDP-glucose dehydrogenase family protein n=1 Tax=unclassified Pseudomonas TaxID=196821 RepID=UPI00177C1923|nr:MULTISPECIES: UDP-glucose/GDP-mannose dehydrogenase family protein [unclassified Pseudomonas]MBD9574065.1 UDP-glucose/GDP-mannose dehydrogenase family protein [Pseudomonas sp. PDM23]MBD9671903.1 UDP-glucose/GDP-mannose dehydrogenase family protein [Pseudomonas sp. PDM21]MDL2425527.1 UDP-glucose/GDP-mannose dehydrogenase family protein [Pseudomonas sp. BJa5]